MEGSPAELQLIEALRAGDEAAFAELVRAYHVSLLRVAQIYVASRAAAEEVVQETWEAVLNGALSRPGRCALARALGPSTTAVA